jgi:tRNA/tmRNA/rRNA uracil-C5-methylase (TrmA/RlmC/RlmD family)
VNREREGLPPVAGAFLDRRPDPTAPYETTIVENGLSFLVNYGEGQKTGFFLDQKYNRRAVAKIARGRRVLDCCTHTGAFALNAAKGGAESVVALDISDAAVALARENVARNGYEDRVTVVRCDVFDYLAELEKNKRRDYDLIVLDPPRDGIHPKALEKIIRFDVDRIVYISCKPTSLARDIVIMQEGGYEVKNVSTVDMFSWTNHIESCVLLQRVSNTRPKAITLDVEMEDYYRIKGARTND